MLTELSLSGYNRRTEDAKGCVGDLDNAPVARPNHRGHARSHLDCNDDLEERNGIELDGDLPIKRQENREEYNVKADFSPFNSNHLINEFLDWLLKVESTSI